MTVVLPGRHAPAFADASCAGDRQQGISPEHSAGQQHRSTRFIATARQARVQRGAPASCRATVFVRRSAAAQRWASSHALQAPIKRCGLRSIRSRMFSAVQPPVQVPSLVVGYGGARCRPAASGAAAPRRSAAPINGRHGLACWKTDAVLHAGRCRAMRVSCVRFGKAACGHSRARCLGMARPCRPWIPCRGAHCAAAAAALLRAGAGAAGVRPKAPGGLDAGGRAAAAAAVHGLQQGGRRAG